MQPLNYNHLLYFWLAAREGSVSKAAAKLRLAQPTVTGQIRRLEAAFGERLFERAGRGLRLTETGRIAFHYADQIFTLGEELVGTLRRHPAGRPMRVTIGLADVVTKPMAYRLIRPLLEPPDPIRLIVREDSPEKLLAALVAHELDVLLLDAPPGPEAGVRVFSQLLGESGAVVLATPTLARRHRPSFPARLEGAPFLLPGRTTGLRRSLTEWFERHRIRPLVVGEFDDAALAMTFGQAGSGLFAVPMVVEEDVKRQYGVQRVGVLDRVREQFFAVSLQRPVVHPGVLRLMERAHALLFGTAASGGRRQRSVKGGAKRRSRKEVPQ
ncbi:MAG: LysR family transcriptional regulator [Candidatus Eisenbacteria bacterium]